MVSPKVHSGSATGQRRLGHALILVAVFAAVEAVGGWLSGSLALLADAGHMVTDAFALGLALLGFWLGRRPADAQRSYGYRRLEVLAAWINGVLLTGIALWIMVEAALRLVSPIPIHAEPMLAVAALGLAVNLATLWILRQGDRGHINLQGALLHVLGDLLGSVAAVSAAVVILLTGWTPIDPLLSLVVALLILRSAWALVRRATHILLEGTPEDIDLDAMEAELVRAVPEVTEVHHIHAWLLTSGSPLLTLHVRVREGADRDGALRRIKEELQRLYDVTHSVVQVEKSPCPDTRIPSGNGSRTAALIAGLCVAGSVLPAAGAAAAPTEGGEVVVFAAASTTNAVRDIARHYSEQGRAKIVTSFAGSSTLARQIENGAPADIFISANEAWMDYLARRTHIDPASRSRLFRNRLVLVAPADSPVSLTVAPGFALAEALGDGRLAVADPAHVPAGLYARAALESLGVWRDVRGRLAPMADVRAALTLVERGEAPLGLVYATDARVSPEVKVVGAIPRDAAPDITYVAAMVSGAGPAARAFLDYLVGPEARAVFAREGFVVD